VRYGYMDRVQHNEAFMEALVLQLLQQVLERRGVGSRRAAQRLLAALTDKASGCKAGSGVMHPGKQQRRTISAGGCSKAEQGVLQLSGAGGSCRSSGGAAEESRNRSSGVACSLQALAAAMAAAAAAGSGKPVNEAAAAAAGDSRTFYDTERQRGAIIALIEELTAAELVEILTPASAQQNHEAMQQLQQQQQQQVQNTWSIKARASLTQQQQQQLGRSVSQTTLEQLEEVGAEAAASEGDSSEVLACITLSSSGGPVSAAGQHKAATSAPALDAGANCKAVFQSGVPHCESSSDATAPAAAATAAAVAPLQKTASFLSGLRQRVSFKLPRRMSEPEHGKYSSNAGHQQAIANSGDASQQSGAGKGALGVLERPSYWDKLQTGHADDDDDSDGDGELFDSESADTSADMAAVVSAHEEGSTQDSLQQQQQQQQPVEGSGTATPAGKYNVFAGSGTVKSNSSRALQEGIADMVEKQIAAAASEGSLVLSQEQLAALHEAAQLLQAYHRR
jgi:hypothetical protein